MMKRTEIKEIIEEEKSIYMPGQYLFMKWSHHKRYLLWKTLANFRMARYWKLEMEEAGFIRRIYAKLAYRYYLRQRNIFGSKSGLEIGNHCELGRRLDIWHGGVVISGHLGDDCVIHGNNIIGNKGNGNMEIPTLGNRVDLGVGAVVIGGIKIADGCRIGANAVVTKDFKEADKLIVGIPAEVKG